VTEVIPTRSAQELLGERGILRIEHEGEMYTLRITRNNRLILTK
jgi:hemin uptake protein HemP